MTMMVRRRAGAKPGLKVSSQRRLEQCGWEPVDKRIREELLPLRAVKALIAAQRLLELLLRRVDTQEANGSSTVELGADGVAIRDRFVQRLNRSVALAPDAHDGSRTSVTERKEGLGHIVSFEIRTGVRDSQTLALPALSQLPVNRLGRA